MLNDSIINVKLKTKREKIKIAAKKLFEANARWGSLNFMQDSICAGGAIYLHDAICKSAPQLPKSIAALT